MNNPWFKVRPGLLKQIKEDLQRSYSDLQVVEETDILYVRGSFPVSHNGQVLDRFQIQIKFPLNYPKSLPTVRETAGRIPRILDRHVIPSNGNACLFVEEEWLLEVGREPRFLTFLDGPVRNFFLGQSLVETGQPWPFGERSHGRKGVVETYGEWFGTQDESMVIRYLECLSREGLKGHWDCPCGSGKRIRQCHFEKIRALRPRIPVWLAHQALERLKLLEKFDTKLAALANQS